MALQITLYDIIKGPVLSDKAYKANDKLGKLVLRIHPSANKPMVAEAVEKLFDVKVEKVAILNRKPKRKKVGRRTIFGPAQKKAIITLKKGYTVDMFGQADMELPENAQPATKKEAPVAVK